MKHIDPATLKSGDIIRTSAWTYIVMTIDSGCVWLMDITGEVTRLPLAAFSQTLFMMEV